jgi:hypothetical protein
VILSASEVRAVKPKRRYSDVQRAQMSRVSPINNQAPQKQKRDFD